MTVSSAAPTLDDVIVIDTETGGLDPDRVSLLTLALVPGDGAAPLDLTVAESEIVVTPRSLEITRLDPEVIRRTGLAPVAACDRIDAWLAAHARGRKRVCAGHNVAFDIAFTRRLYRLAGRSLPDFFSHRTLDTHTLLWGLRAAGRLPPNVVGSDAAFAHFGIEPATADRHTALGDARATLNLLRALVELL
ncbi:MAG: exonuclease domain-containing protein [Bradymonadia bacterium]